MRHDHANIAMRNLERLIARDPLLRDIVNPQLPAPSRSARFTPAVDVVEEETGWRILMDVPGVSREKLKVHLDGTKLTISGERSRGPQGPQRRVSERECGPFKREFLIPFQVRAQEIQAKLEEGVLEVTLPRTGPSATRDIHID